MGFALEPSQPFLVLREVVREDFDRNVPAQLRVGRAVDDTHATIAKQAGDFVMDKGFADHQGSFGGLVSSY